MRYFFAAATNERRPDRNLLLHEFEHDSSRKNKKERTRQNNCINLSNGDFYSGSEKKVNRNSFLGGGGGGVGIASLLSKTHTVWNAFRQFRSLCQLRAAITRNDGPVSSFQVKLPSTGLLLFKIAKTIEYIILHTTNYKFT